MTTIGSQVVLVTLLYATSLFRSPTLQPGKSPVVVDIKPYPGSVEFCTEHVVGAPGRDGKAGPHISWTGYYSVDIPEKVIGHYRKLLGSENHRKEGDEDIWRFPFEKPEQVLTITHPGGTFPRGNCARPPRSARTIVISSTMARPD